MQLRMATVVATMALAVVAIPTDTPVVQVVDTPARTIALASAAPAIEWTVTSERTGQYRAGIVSQESVDSLMAVTGETASVNGLSSPQRLLNGEMDAEQWIAYLRSQPDALETAANKMPAHLFDLAQHGGDEQVEIIVRHAGSGANYEAEYLKALGGEVVRDFPAMDMRAIGLRADALVALSVDQQIAWLSPDDEVRAMSTTMHGSAGEPSKSSVNDIYTGSGIGIAVVDSGVSAHADLPAGIIQYDFRDPSQIQVDSLTGKLLPNMNGRVDGFGHGTHISATIRGSGNDSAGDYRGLAPGAQIISLQTLNADGSGQSSAVIAALDWLLSNAEQHNIRVVNLSLGRAVGESNATDPLVLAAERVWDAGIVVVAAAGNDGYSGNMTINSPGNSRKIITVGSLTDAGSGNNADDDYVSTFSSRGPSVGDLVVKPDLVAPGNKIVAAIHPHSTLTQMLPGRRKGCKKAACNSEYLEMSGTSMATGVVSAAVALMLEKSPNLTPDTVKARLMRSARKLVDEPTAVGAGTLDVDAALSDTGMLYGQALSPVMLRDEATGGILIEDTANLWGHSQWAASVIYPGASQWASADNGTLVTGSGEVQGTGFLWTDEDVWARGFLWTDEDVWARGFLWTDEDDVGARSLVESNGKELIVNDDP